MNAGSEDGHSRRDRHLFGPGPKRLLTLDGGGVRGAISVAFLEEMEALLEAQEGPDVRLADWFDFIGGTSTGAIIAGALALGKRARDVKEFYLDRARQVFENSYFRVPYVQTKFVTERLEAEIERVVGNRTLDSEDLITGFGLVTKRVDTGSPWILANNKRAPYWMAESGTSRVANRDYSLSKLVRASTAAPTFFKPQRITIFDDGKGKSEEGLFLDGGVTPSNNPALAFFLMTILQRYGICWKTGTENLTIVSIGAGTYRDRLTGEPRFMPNLRLAVHALSSLISDSQTQVLALMQWLGKSPMPWEINSEIGDLAADVLPGGPLFKFVRYDVELEAEPLKKYGVLSEEELLHLREMDRADMIPLAYEIGRSAAKEQVKPEHFGLAPSSPIS